MTHALIRMSVSYLPVYIWMAFEWR